MQKTLSFAPEMKFRNELRIEICDGSLYFLNNKGLIFTLLSQLISEVCFKIRQSWFSYNSLSIWRFYAKLLLRFIMLVPHLCTYNNTASVDVTSVYTFINELSSYNLINLWWRYMFYTNTTRRCDDLTRKTNINVYHWLVIRNKLSLLDL